MIRFILNNQTVAAAQFQGSTILDYIRYYKRLMGTKIGCREGDCGACTILVGSLENGNLIYRSMTSCLMPIGNANAKHIVTIEGVNMQSLSPVQQAIVDSNGSQCGFCTLGFVMSFTGFILAAKSKTYEEAITAIDGNICRCTGYKSIERSAKIIADSVANKPREAATQWLVENEFLPRYFLTIEQRLRSLKADNAMEVSKKGNGNHSIMVAGGTDLLVQKPLTVKQSPVQLLFDADFLKGITEKNNQCYIGGGVTVSEFLESPLIQAMFPHITKHIKLVSSTPVRNMATMAGNIVNASPIGDMTVFFLALDANIVLAERDKERTILLKDFYKGYKQVDKAPGEIITHVIFNIPGEQTVFNFEKVSKRNNLDIASVNTACLLKMDEKNEVESVHLSAGGVAPFPKYLNSTCAYLQGKKINAETLELAVKTMYEEIAPISDARGSSDYKRLLLRQLVLAHFVNFFGVTDDIKRVMLR